MDNKRKNKRLGCIVPVEGKEGGVFDNIRTLDISKGGIGFISEHEIPLNEKIAVEIDLSEKEDPVFAIGKVKWVIRVSDSSSFRIGLSFEDVVKGSKTRLNKYFESKK